MRRAGSLIMLTFAMVKGRNASLEGSSQASFRSRKDRTYRIAVGDVGVLRENGFTLDILQGS